MCTSSLPLRAGAWLALCALATACATGRPAPQAHERVVERSADDRPDWLAHVPASEIDRLYSVGRAQAGSEAGALIDAREDAYRQLVDTHYGSTLAKRYERVRTEIGREIVDRLVSASEGRVAGARDRQVYWERIEVQRSASEVGYYYRGYVLVEVDRARFDRAVERWIATSPAVVESEQLVARATQLAAEQARAAQAALAAAAEGRLLDLARLSARVGAAERELAAATARYRELRGAPLPIALEESRALVERVRTAVARAQRAIQVAVAVVGSSAAARRAALGERLSRTVADMGLAARIAGGTRPCEDGGSHALTLAVEAPRCRRPGMGVACEIPVDLALYACPTRELLGRTTVEGLATRGAAMDEPRAVEDAWQAVTRGDGFAAALRSFFERHIPVAPLPTGEPDERG